MAFVPVISNKKSENSDYKTDILAGDGWMKTINKGDTLRIVDLDGNQAADTLFFLKDDPADHYSASMTIQEQASLYLSTGTVLMSESGREMLRITADTCGQHDTIGGACSCQSNTVRYQREKVHMHACRDTFMLQMSNYSGAYTFSKRDLAPNINFFMNVPVAPDGGLDFKDGVSGPGYYVELEALEDVIVLISNCPQLNNPCNDYNPTPIQVLLWEGE
ncbi:urea carboxylase [Enterococcus florum]|uniref:Urea carboxylase n=1 Tax=Enterococcus florum TaxID=2480627 RepID=A0A4P5P4T2_9ENTE|nr:urea amidolyase associated protein UAAP2 [Enterococcus florum]GCF92670.1 urea carboxylase [Enterococcus florum]